MLTFYLDKQFLNNPIEDLMKFSLKYKATIIIKNFARITNGEIIYFH